MRLEWSCQYACTIGLRFGREYACLWSMTSGEIGALRGLLCKTRAIKHRDERVVLLAGYKVHNLESCLCS